MVFQGGSDESGKRSVRGHARRVQKQLTKDLARVEHGLGTGHILQREDFLDDRLDLTLLDQTHHIQEILPRAGEGSE